MGLGPNIFVAIHLLRWAMVGVIVVGLAIVVLHVVQGMRGK